MEMATQTMPGTAGGTGELENTFLATLRSGKDTGGGAMKLSNEQTLAQHGINPDSRMPQPSQERRAALTRAQFDARWRKMLAAGKGDVDVAGLEQEQYICSEYPQLKVTVVEGRSGSPDGRIPAAAAINVKFGGRNKQPGSYWTPNFDELVNDDLAKFTDMMVSDDEEKLTRMARRKAAQQILVIKEHLSPEGLLAWHADLVGKITKVEKVQAPSKDDQSAAAIELLKKEGLLDDKNVASIVANLEKKRRGGLPDTAPPMSASSLPTDLSRESIAPMRGKPGARREAPQAQPAAEGEKKD